MRIVRTLLLGVGVAACGDGGTAPGGVARVEIRPEGATLDALGATQQFTARALDEHGDPVDASAITWRSSDSTAVWVDRDGLVTAWASGTATVTAAIEGVSGSVPVRVEAPPCTTPIVVQLQPGEVLSAHPPGAGACPLLLPSGSPGDRYRIAVVRTSGEPSATAPLATLTVVGRGVTTEPVVASPARPAAPAPDPRVLERLARSARVARATADAHARLREAEARLFARVGPLPPAPAPLPAGPQAAAPARRTFTARPATESSCTARPPVTGVLVAENDDIVLYQDSAGAASARALNPAHVERLLAFYADHGRPTVAAYFGRVPDRDANGKVVVFAVPDSVIGDQVAAFVWGGDMLPRSACPASHEMEIVYFRASLINAMSGGNYQALETLVHEVKHLASFDQRLSGVSFTLPPPWIEEGAAEIAGEAASRRAWAAAGGPAQNARVTRSSLRRETPENFGVRLRVYRTAEYLAEQPNAVVFARPGAGYSIYGSGWHFLRFLGDAYGAAAVAPAADAPLFLQQTAAATAPGLDGLAALTGKGFAALMEEYAAAVMLTGTGTPAPARGFTTYDFASATAVFAAQDLPAVPYPYPVTAAGAIPSASFAGGSWPGRIGNGGLRIHDLVSNGTGTGAELRVEVAPPARVVMVRLN